MKRRRIVGIDVGGTQMTLAIADERATLIAHLRARGQNLAIAGADGVAVAIQELVERAGADRIDALVVGAAGAANPELARRLERALRRRIDARKVRVVNDVALLTELVPRGRHAVVLSVGTGAVAFAKTRSDVLHRIDGWGPLAGDRGSGYSIGLAAVQAALAAHDGRARRPSFARAVLAALDLKRPDRDIASFYEHAPRQREVAALAPLVVRAARRGDAIARTIVADAAAAVADTLRAACTRVGRGPTTLILTGGLGRAFPELFGDALALARKRGIELGDAPAAEAAALALGYRLARVTPPAAAVAELERRLGRQARAVPAPRRRRSALARTERDNPRSARFSFETPRTMVDLMNAEDARVAPAVRAISGKIARAVELVAARLEKRGRLVYVGAGTSGRLGTLDASEIPPTFGERPGRVVAVIAGGVRALTEAVEGAEDDAGDGARQMRRLRITARDAVVGLSVSGGAAFVLGAIAEARRRRALTLAITCNAESPLARRVQVPLVIDVGPEVITGSSRLKAGTAQKMILNMLLTCSMARLGFVTGNLMTRVTPSNAKLRERAVRIAATVLGVPEPVARERLETAHWSLQRVLSRRTSRRR